MPEYNKLVRDRIPEIISENGKTYEAITLSDEAFKIELRRKLLEEVNEYLEVSSNEEAISELGDVVEVICALAGVHGKGYEDIEVAREEKEKERGGFSNKVFLKTVDE
ncbi:nucleoside triphosphate pyrophosphohydrolase [Alkalihalobacillus sp. CinArs1]|uniref:nucleoside triphosphate pyrophosphohydrolase n=1 Tax=Alkalihalobacillus sp. CinArs1 TaxID=2995314 RepID=UPI0022DD8750|nr:nucleoside triphosphate pyrophosphohydrolase [Alkalihalobacillus sp. CinArs1]